MRVFSDSNSVFSGLGRYRIRTILIIAFSWTLIDIIVSLISENPHVFNPVKSITLREIFVFFMSAIMGYLFVFTLRDVFRQNSLWLNFLFTVCFWGKLYCWVKMQVTDPGDFVVFRDKYGTRKGFGNLFF